MGEELLGRLKETFSKMAPEEFAQVLLYGMLVLDEKNIVDFSIPLGERMDCCWEAVEYMGYDVFVEKVKDLLEEWKAFVESLKPEDFVEDNTRPWTIWYCKAKLYS